MNIIQTLAEAELSIASKHVEQLLLQFLVVSYAADITEKEAFLRAKYESEKMFRIILLCEEKTFSIGH